MNRKNPITISKSSLIGLQAELARKREEISRNRCNVERKTKKLEMKPHIQEQLQSFKQKNKTKAPVPDFVEEDPSVLTRSREVLIVKSALYEKLQNQELKPTSDDQYLVNFENNKPVNPRNEENADEDSDPESEWVTFTDSLGRSRTCLRADMKYYKELDTTLSVEKRSKETKTDESKDEPSSHERPIVLSDEMRLWDEKREQLRKMWEEEEKRLSEKKDIHYQDVLFEEARTHGVGYFHFSKDESERQKQHEELRKLRQETEKNQQLTMSVRERREQQMKRRIEAAKRRKRERLGLALDQEDDVIEDKIEEDKKEEPKPEEILAKQVEEYLQNVERSRHVRPWDVGKDSVQPRVLSQGEYNEKERAKRKQEFAPPSSYKIEETLEDEPSGLRFTTKKKKRNYVESIPLPIDSERISKIEVEEKRVEIPPPLSYEKVTTCGRMKKNDLGESIEMGLNQLRREAEMKSKKKERGMMDII